MFPKVFVLFLVFLASCSSVNIRSLQFENIFCQSFHQLLVFGGNIGQAEGVSRIKTRQNRLPKKMKEVITETQQVAQHTKLHDHPSLQMTPQNNIRI